MRKGIVALAVLFLAASAAPSFAGVGDLCPGKYLYKLNLIGSSYKNPDLTSGSGKRIFVKYSKTGSVTSRIYLTQGPFGVCDANSWDAAHDCAGNTIASEGSVFRLPCNLNVPADVECDGGGTEACYDIYLRELGGPGSGSIQTCGTIAGEKVCSNEIVLLNRNGGTPTFRKVTNELSSILVDLTDDGVSNFTRRALFTDPFEDWFWEFINNQLRLVQMRFCGVDC